MSKNIRPWEFKLGRAGLTVFLLGTSLFLFFSFILGVVVGKHLDTYPEKLVALPQSLVRYLGLVTKADTEAKRDEIMTAGGELPDLAPEKTAEADGKHDVVAGMPTEQAEAQRPPSQVTAEQAVIPADNYMIQLAAFREREKAEELCEKIIKFGYEPQIELVDIPSSGQWFRVILKGYKTREETKKVLDALALQVKGLSGVVRLAENGKKR